ncbi:hypothetical protein LOK74_03750 [Brevibacillus humidisoli]|uniref:hypothetical protein n=1 Tax=Brevibacillus humidisoli TaxID=2895522 RepID=UPI001E2F08D0|nr:hypothetical protein [Brevibacillus humidisoli]UFJ41639.1 hypothetical protein LOK74_03750 [Brevibacillus humidisoli]
MSTTELMLRANLEGRVLRTLQSYFRRSNLVLLRESLWATGLEEEQVEEIMSLLDQKYTVSEIMEVLREKNVFHQAR